MPDVTREELRKSEEWRFRSRLDRLPMQRDSAEIDPSVVGWLNVRDAIWWIALHRDLSGAVPFLDAAVYQLTRHAGRCAGAAREADELYLCFTSHVGVAFAKMLAGSADWKMFDNALELLARGWELAPPDDDLGSETPVALFGAAVVALGLLWHRPVPPSLAKGVRSARTTSHFVKLHKAIIGVIDDPSPPRCEEVRKTYRGSVSLNDYKTGVVRGLQLQQLLAMSSVAECGDVVKGALNMFE